MLSVQKNNENRSLKTNRLFPTPNKPDPMPQNLAFLFTKITPDWDIKTSRPILGLVLNCAGGDEQRT